MAAGTAESSDPGGQPCESRAPSSPPPPQFSPDSGSVPYPRGAARGGPSTCTAASDREAIGRVLRPRPDFRALSGALGAGPLARRGWAGIFGLGCYVLFAEESESLRN